MGTNGTPVVGNKVDVYGIGNALMDLQLRIEENDLAELGLTKGSMNLVDGSTQKKLLDRFGNKRVAQASGGSAANTIIAISQLGGKTSYGCLVGDDIFGRLYHQEMDALGVVLPNAPLPEEVTGTSVILITPDGERTMNTSLGISAFFAPEHVNSDAIKNAAWLYVEGYLLSSPTAQEAAACAVEQARQYGTKIAVSFSDAFIVNCFNSHLTSIVKQADLAFANLTEAKAFVGKEEEGAVFSAFRECCPSVVMTLGERGVRAVLLGEEVFEPAVQTKVVDTTGAGDMFAGGILYGLTHGHKPQDACKLACALSSKVVSQLGPRLPDSREAKM